MSSMAAMYDAVRPVIESLCGPIDEGMLEDPEFLEASGLTRVTFRGLPYLMHGAGDCGALYTAEQFVKFTEPSFTLQAGWVFLLDDESESPVGCTWEISVQP